MVKTIKKIVKFWLKKSKRSLAFIPFSPIRIYNNESVVPRSKVGIAPGTAIYTGEITGKEIGIKLFKYDKKECQEEELSPDFELEKYFQTDKIHWLNIEGLYNTKLIDRVCKYFDIHSLIIEDILNTQQRSKIDEHASYIFIVMKMLNYNLADKKIEQEQMSLLIAKGVVLSFQELPGDVFNPIRERIRQNKGKVRGSGADYLAYLLLDAVIDNYFLLLEQIGDSLEEIEVKVLTNPEKSLVSEIHQLRQWILLLRKSIWPLRDIVNGLQKSEGQVFDKSLSIYLRDLYDHSIEIMDIVETYRDMISSLMDLYLSTISNKMNEIMKVLTMISTIFIPLGFMAGIYGMNFKYMPELSWKYGYPVALAVMAILVVGFIIFFKKRKWI